MKIPFALFICELLIIGILLSVHVKRQIGQARLRMLRVKDRGTYYYEANDIVKSFITFHGFVFSTFSHLFTCGYMYIRIGGFPTDLIQLTHSFALVEDGREWHIRKFDDEFYITVTIRLRFIVHFNQDSISCLCSTLYRQ